MRSYFFPSLTLLLACLFFSCQKKAENSFTIQAQVTGMPAQNIILQEVGFNESRLIDSVRADEDGSFKLTGTYREPALYSLRMGNRFLLVVIDGEEINIKANWNDLTHFTVAGSPGTASLNTFINRYNAFNKDIIGLRMAHDSLMNTNAPDSLLQLVSARTDRENENLLAFVKQYADTSKSLPVAIYAASSLITSDETAYLQKFTANLNNRFEPAQLSIDFTNEVKAKLETDAANQGPQTGDEAPGFTATTLDGKEISLKAFKGKYVLLDFWASWCPPCRAENPNVVAAYKTFKDKNFTILGVSLDSDKDKWREAVNNDNLTWTQVSDLKGWDSEIAALYGVQAIPMNFLIDPSGKIIASGLQGDKLEQTLKDNLGAPAGSDIAVKR